MWVKPTTEETFPIVRWCCSYFINVLLRGPWINLRNRFMLACLLHVKYMNSDNYSLYEDIFFIFCDIIQQCVFGLMVKLVMIKWYSSSGPSIFLCRVEGSPSLSIHPQNWHCHKLRHCENKKSVISTARNMVSLQTTTLSDSLFSDSGDLF